MKNLALITLLVGSLTLSAQDKPLDVLHTGEKVSKELLKKLSSNLKHELKTNGLIAAADFCNEKAYTLTQDVNLHQVNGVSVKRISTKVRNPINAPSEDEKLILQKFQDKLGQKDFPAYIIDKTGDTYKYYKPLVIKKDVCLKCHGDISKNEKLTKFMNEHYPDDKATGYKMNDLRGAVVVEIKQ